MGISKSECFNLFYVTAPYEDYRAELVRRMAEILSYTGMFAIAPCIANNWLWKDPQILSDLDTEVWVICTKGWIDCEKLYSELLILGALNVRIRYIDILLDFSGALRAIDRITDEVMVDVFIHIDEFWAGFKSP